MARLSRKEIQQLYRERLELKMNYTKALGKKNPKERNCTA